MDGSVVVHSSDILNNTSIISILEIMFPFIQLIAIAKTFWGKRDAEQILFSINEEMWKCWYLMYAHF